MKLLRIVFVTLSSAIASASSAHEFWIEVEDHTVAPGETLRAALKVGEAFEGPSYAYIPQNFRRFEVALAGGAPRAVDGRIGDRPALSISPEAEGLLTILHVTRDYDLTWESWQQFADFVAHKSGAGVLDRHAALGYPQDAVRETYSRHAKALAAVGDGAGQDRAHGLLTEIVALENPYAGDLSDGLDVQLLYQGEPRADEQIEVFARGGDGTVEIGTVRTDATGVATVQVEPGHSYLLDAVVFRQPDTGLSPDFDPMWETLWASLTFAVPAD